MGIRKLLSRAGVAAAMVFALAGCAAAPPEKSESGDHSTSAVPEPRETSRGVIGSWSFAPLQTAVWYENGPLYLFDGETTSLLLLDPFSCGGKLHAGIISLTGADTELKYNRGICCGLFTDCSENYGISCGAVGGPRENYGLVSEIIGGAGWNYGVLCGPATWAYWNNHGVQIGVVNASGGGGLQICGLNIADRFWLGACNWTDDRAVAVGVFNLGRRVKLQIGLLNYDRDAPIPLLPGVNFCP